MAYEDEYQYSGGLGTSSYYGTPADYGMDFNPSATYDGLDLGYQIDADGNISFADITILPDGSIVDPANNVYSVQDLEDPGIWSKITSGLSGSLGTLGAAALMGGAGYLGSKAASDAQTRATDTAASINQQALNQQKDIYAQQRADFEPYRKLGEAGVDQYYRFAQDPNAYLNTPAYAWQKNEIDKNMNRQLSARGRSNSTYGMNSLANAYGNLATNEYQNAYNRVLDPIKIGQGAAASTGQFGSNMASMYGQNATNAGNIAMTQGNNQASLYSGLGALPINVLSAYNGLNTNQAMTNYLNRQG